MTTLVTRLRGNQTARHLCGLAADEIERLTKALAECAAPFDTGPTTVGEAAVLVGKEFQRRMNIAGEAIG
jgi:hypothetical protein